MFPLLQRGYIQILNWFDPRQFNIYRDREHIKDNSPLKLAKLVITYVSACLQRTSDVVQDSDFRVLFCYTCYYLNAVLLKYCNGS